MSLNLSVSELIKSRRTIHKFKRSQIPDREKIIAAIEHAVWAPNHRTTEPWRFYIVGDETAEKICQLNYEVVKEERGEKFAEAKTQRWREIPGWLLITHTISGDQIRNQEDYAATCCAAHNLMLYLWNEGIGVKWSTGAVIRTPEFYKLNGIDPLKENLVGMYWYGYPEEVPQMSRKSLEEVVSELP